MSTLDDDFESVFVISILSFAGIGIHVNQMLSSDIPEPDGPVTARNSSRNWLGRGEK